MHLGQFYSKTSTNVGIVLFKPINLGHNLIKNFSPMNLFFIEIENEQFGRLEGDEARHAIRVLRKKPGDRIYGIDGKGFYYETRVEALGKDKVELKLLNRQAEYGEHEWQLEIAISPLRLTDHFEWLVEKAVEMGATTVFPVLCDRTVKPSLKFARLDRIMKAALKQCKRSRLPVLEEPVELDDWIEGQSGGLNLIATCESAVPLSTLRSEITLSNPVRILIGPEGDFSDREIELARAAGFREVSLGDNRLRSESAAVYLLSVIKFLKEY